MMKKPEKLSNMFSELNGLLLAKKPDMFLCFFSNGSFVIFLFIRVHNVFNDFDQKKIFATRCLDLSLEFLPD